MKNTWRKKTQKKKKGKTFFCARAQKIFFALRAPGPHEKKQLRKKGKKK